MFTNKQLEGSCGDVATALGLSPIATLALRVSLMILTRIISVPGDRSLAVTIGSSYASIRVLRIRRSTSTRNRKTKCTGEVGSTSTATTRGSTEPPPPGALSSGSMTDNGSPIDSAATMIACM